MAKNAAVASRFVQGSSPDHLSRDVAFRFGMSEFNAVAAGLLGTIQSLVGGLDNLLDGSSPRPGFSDADADGHRELTIRGFGADAG